MLKLFLLRANVRRKVLEIKKMLEGKYARRICLLNRRSSMMTVTCQL